MLQKYLDIGKIVNTHGIRGEVKVVPLTDDPSRYEQLDRVYIEGKTGLDELQIESVKYFKSFVILKFKGINDMNSAIALKDSLLKIDRKNAVVLPKDSFFISDIIGCEVFTPEGEKLGILVEVLQTGSNDVYVVKNDNQKEILIPALKSVVKEISVENQRMTVELPEGLRNDEI